MTYKKKKEDAAKEGKAQAAAQSASQRAMELSYGMAPVLTGDGGAGGGVGSGAGGGATQDRDDDDGNGDYSADGLEEQLLRDEGFEDPDRIEGEMRARHRGGSSEWSDMATACAASAAGSSSSSSSFVPVAAPAQPMRSGYPGGGSEPGRRVRLDLALETTVAAKSSRHTATRSSP